MSANQEIPSVLQLEEQLQATPSMDEPSLTLEASQSEVVLPVAEEGSKVDDVDMVEDDAAANNGCAAQDAADGEGAPQEATGQSKTKSKAKCKGKGRGKAKRSKVTKNATDGTGEGHISQGDAQKAKPKKLTLKMQVEADVKGRGVKEAMAEAQACMKEIEEQISELAASEEGLAGAEDDAKKVLEAATAKVDAMMQLEAEAIDKMKIARQVKVAAHQELKKASAGREEESQKLILLEVELQAREQVAELEEVKKAAQKEVEEAKKAILEAKAKEKEIMDEMKEKLRGQRGQLLALKIDGEETQPQQAVDPVKDVQKQYAAEMKAIEKGVQAREKQREKMLQTATAPDRSRKALMPPPSKASSAKMARVEAETEGLDEA